MLCLHCLPTDRVWVSQNGLGILTPTKPKDSIFPLHFYLLKGIVLSSDTSTFEVNNNIITNWSTPLLKLDLNVSNVEQYSSDPLKKQLFRKVT